MKTKILKEIFTFLVGFLILHGLMTLFYFQMMSGSRLARTEKQFQSFPTQIKYLILGDSHPQSAINPDFLGGSFNFSSTSEHYPKMYYKLKHIIDHKTKSVDTVILPLDLQTFSGVYTNEPEDSWYWKKYIEYGEYGAVHKNSWKYKIVNLKGSFFPYAQESNAFIDYTRKLTKDKKKATLINGFLVRNINPQRNKVTDTNALNRVLNHFNKVAAIEDHILTYFFKTLELCKENNIKVVLIRYPITSRYYNTLTRLSPYHEAFPEKMESFNQKVLADYPDAVYVDALDLYFDHEEYFYDTDHLNVQGAEAFTRYLGGILEKSQ